MEEVLTKGNNCAIIVTLGITNGANAASDAACMETITFVLLV
jgi:hypothetical protein